MWVWHARDGEVIEARERSDDGIKFVGVNENPAQSEGFESVAKMSLQHREIVVKSRLRVDNSKRFEVGKDHVCGVEVQCPSLYGGVCQREGMNAVHDARVLEQS